MDCTVLTYIDAHEADEENVDKVLTGRDKMAALLERAAACPVKKRQKAIINKFQNSIQLVSNNDYRIGF
jgi:hypothetical protein